MLKDSAVAVWRRWDSNLQPFDWKTKVFLIHLFIFGESFIPIGVTIDLECPGNTGYIARIHLRAGGAIGGHHAHNHLRREAIQHNPDNTKLQTNCNLGLHSSLGSWNCSTMQ